MPKLQLYVRPNRKAMHQIIPFLQFFMIISSVFYILAYGQTLADATIFIAATAWSNVAIALKTNNLFGKPLGRKAKARLSSCAIVITFLVFYHLYFLGSAKIIWAQSAAYCCDGDEWLYRKSHVITGSTAAAVTNYQMNITIYNTTGTDAGSAVYVGSNARSDFGDVRFTDSSGNLLDYWIETFGSNYAKFWVEVSSIPQSPSTATIYIYYGKSSATTTSNGTNTFLFFDNFNDNSFDSNKWALTSSYPAGSTVTEHDGMLDMYYRRYAYSQTDFPSPIVLEFNAKRDAADKWYPFGISRFDGGTSGGNYWPTNGIFCEVEPTANNKATFNRMLAGVNLQLTNFAWQFSANTWFAFTFKDGKASYTSRVLINGVEKTTTTNAQSYATNRVSAGAAHESTASHFYVDDFRVRKYVDPEPAHSTWGSNETKDNSQTWCEDCGYNWMSGASACCGDDGAADDFANSSSSSLCSYCEDGTVESNTRPNDPSSASASHPEASSSTVVNVSATASDSDADNVLIKVHNTSIPSAANLLCTGNAVSSGSVSWCTFTASAVGCGQGTCTVYVFTNESSADSCGQSKQSASYDTASFTYDTVAPTFSLPAEYPTDPATYAPNKNYQFNITISDATTSVNKAILEFNGVNYTDVSNDGSVYYRTLTDLTANPSGYSYKWYANDSVNNWGTSSTYTYTITKGPSVTRLFLNGTEGNSEYIKTEIANITATSNITSLTVKIYANYSGSLDIIASGIGLAQNDSDTGNLNLGPYLVKANSTENENYTSSQIEYTLTVVDRPNINPVLVNTSTPTRGGGLKVEAKLSYTNGSLIQNQNITFRDETAGLTMGTDFTNSSGYAEASYIIPAMSTTGSHTINVTYGGNATILTHSTHNDSVSVDVYSKSNITFITTDNQTINSTASITLVARVLDSINGSAVHNYPCNFYDNSTALASSVLTNSSGYCNYSWDTTGFAAGLRTVKVNISANATLYYFGDTPYDNHTITLTINALPRADKPIFNVTSVEKGDVVHISCVVRDAEDSADNLVVNISILRPDNEWSNETVGSVGNIFFRNYSTDWPLGNYTVVCSAVDSLGGYNESANATFLVWQNGTVSMNLNVTEAWWGDPINISGKAMYIDGLNALANDNVTVNVGGITKCTIQTNNSGDYECNFLSPSRIGKYTVRVDVLDSTTLKTITNTTYLVVMVRYGGTEMERRMASAVGCYEEPFIIQNPDGTKGTAMTRVCVWK